MTIRRRDRGLSGDDMGCDGSWDMTDDLLERLRALPGATPLFDALADVPGVWVVGGAVRDTLLGRDPRDLDLVVEGDAAAAARLLGEEPLVHERFGTATATRRGQPRRGAPRALRAPGCAAGGRARRPDRRGPRAARLQRQRDRRADRRRRARGAPGRARGPRARGGCACCTSARSSTTRRACCA